MANKAPLKAPAHPSVILTEASPPDPNGLPVVSFEEKLLAVASGLRGEMAALVGALPGPVAGGADLKKQLGLANTVCWQVYSFVASSNPVAAIGQVPGRTAMTRLLQAARRIGLADDLTGRVEHAFDQFEAFTREHAHDRATLNTLASGLATDEGGAANDLRWRRSALRDNSHIWGVQAQTTLLCAVLHASAEPGGIDAALVGGYTKVHALRKQVPLRLLVRSGTYDTQDAPALKPFVQPNESYLLEEFSTRPFPRLETAPDPTGMLETSLWFDGIGKASAVDVFTAKVVRNASRGEPQPWHGTTKTITVPSEVLVLDLLVPRGWTNPSSVHTSTHGNPAILESLMQRVPEFEMPVKETAVYAGTDLRAFESSDVPRYPEMLRSVLDQLGWAATTFDIYRCRVRYPIMHALVHLRVDTVKG